MVRQFRLAPDVAVRILALNGVVLYASDDLGPFPSTAALPWLSDRLPLQPVAFGAERRFVALPIVRDGRSIGVIELSHSL